jgi:cis-L-3-hydroxyproline dehydratase
VWSTHQARRFLRATRHLDYYLEQPCATYEECRALRNDCDRPLVLDESIVDLASLLVESFCAPILALADDPLRR